MDLEVVDALRAVGVPDDKARAVAVSLHREIDQRYALHAAQLVTRGDLAEAVARLETKIAETKVDLLTTLTQTKGELIRWSVGSFIAMAGVFAAISRLMLH